MSDDIVTRLRMSADLINGFPKALAKSVFPTGWLSEAADEIELLRKNVEFWEKRYWQLVAEVTP